MQVWNILPFSLAYSRFAQTMSSLSVLEAPGSEASPLEESRHAEAHGEFGVTCKAVLSA